MKCALINMVIGDDKRDSQDLDLDDLEEDYGEPELDKNEEIDLDIGDDADSEEGVNNLEVGLGWDKGPKEFSSPTPSKNVKKNKDFQEIQESTRDVRPRVFKKEEPLFLESDEQEIEPVRNLESGIEGVSDTKSGEEPRPYEAQPTIEYTDQQTYHSGIFDRAVPKNVSLASPDQAIAFSGGEPTIDSRKFSRNLSEGPRVKDSEMYDKKIPTGGESQRLPFQKRKTGFM